MLCPRSQYGLVRSRSCEGVHVDVRGGDGRIRSVRGWRLLDSPDMRLELSFQHCLLAQKVDVGRGILDSTPPKLKLDWDRFKGVFSVRGSIPRRRPGDQYLYLSQGVSRTQVVNDLPCSGWSVRILRAWVDLYCYVLHGVVLYDLGRRGHGHTSPRGCCVPSSMYPRVRLFGTEARCQLRGTTSTSRCHTDSEMAVDRCHVGGTRIFPITYLIYQIKILDRLARVNNLWIWSMHKIWIILQAQSLQKS